MSGPDEINHENYKHRNENEINSPILLMSMNNLNTEINATHTHTHKKIKLSALLTEQLKKANNESITQETH